MADAPSTWNLLRVAPCRACGRPAAEGCACGWCGERAPIAPSSLADLLLFAIGLMLCGIGDFHGPGADALAAAHLAPLLSVLSALAGWAVAEPLRETPSGRFRALPAAALAAGAAALAAKLAPVDWTGTAWLFPAAVLAALLLAPAPLPPVPAPTTPGRLAQRFTPPLLLAAAMLAIFVWSFATTGPTALSLLGLAAFLCALGRRLRRPALLLVPAAACLGVIAPDPGVFALGVVATGAAALISSTKSP